MSVLFSASVMYNRVTVERRCFVNQGSGGYEFYLWPKLGDKHVVGGYYKWVEGELLPQKVVCIFCRKGYQFLESFEALEGHEYLLLDTGRAFWGSITIRLPYSYTLP